MYGGSSSQVDEASLDLKETASRTRMHALYIIPSRWAAEVFEKCCRFGQSTGRAWHRGCFRWWQGTQREAHIPKRFRALVFFFSEGRHDGLHGRRCAGARRRSSGCHPKESPSSSQAAKRHEQHECSLEKKFRSLVEKEVAHTGCTSLRVVESMHERSGRI